MQCLNEFASVARRKQGMGWPEVHEALEIVRAFCRPVIALDTELHLLGLRLAEQYQLSIYDAMIAAAARIAGCDMLYSEDMHHGLMIDTVLKIVNPFRA